VNDLIELTETEWMNRFSPMPSDSNYALFDLFDGNNKFMLEKYPEEISMIKSGVDEYIWTVKKDDSGDYYIVNGHSDTDRIGYFIAIVPFDKQLNYKIKITTNIKILKKLGLREVLSKEGDQ
jgi:hypothetical protein